MPGDFKALIVVLALAAPAFYLGRRLSASTIGPREFAIWRNAWFGATTAAFLSSSFLVYVAIMMMICLYAYAARAATVALFIILLFAVPLVRIQIPGFNLINYLFEIDNGRLLAIAVLLPIVLTIGRLGRRSGGSYSAPDRLIVCYVLLRVGLEIQRSEITQFLRATTLFTLDMLIPYFAFSRAVATFADLRKVLLAFVVAVLPLSLIAVFETAKGWILYSSIVANWADFAVMGYLRREGIMRATASASSPIVLGFIIMVAIGCGIALRQAFGLRRFVAIALTIFGAGLMATISRGPWVGVVILIFVYLATSRNAAANFAKVVVIGAIVLLPLLLTPVGDRMLDLLPFVGNVDTGSVTYRQRLFDSAVLVIERNPWFGSNDYWSAPEMKQLVQGEHIIDIVNSYLKIALDSGLVGLSLFFSFFATILYGLWRVAVQERDLSPYARASMATLIAILVTIGTVSSIDYVPYVYWSFAGLCVALIRIAYRERVAVAGTADASEVLA
jgi:O-antigen ligase